MGKGCFWDSFTRIVACYGFYVKGERAFLGVDVFCDVCCKTFWVKTFHPNLVDYFRGVSLIGSGFVEVVRVLKFSFIQLRFEKKGMYHSDCLLFFDDLTVLSLLHCLIVFVFFHYLFVFDRNCWFVLMVFSFHFFLGWCV